MVETAGEGQLRPMSPSSAESEQPWRLSNRARGITESVTLALSARAKELKAEGKDVVSFTAGEPDLPVPEDVQEAGIQAIRDGLGKYTAVAGIKELREAAALRFQSMGLDYSPDEVLISAGAKSAIFLALFAMLNEGDEVIFPGPYWGSYEDMVAAAGGLPVVLPTQPDNDFQPQAQKLENLVTHHTKAILLNSPNNPTGTVYTRETLEEIAEVLRGFPQLMVLSDDIYDALIYTGEPFLSLPLVAPDLKDRCLSINSLSKSHSMTGWRMGYTGGPKALIASMARIQSQVAGSPPAISQYAALQAFARPLDPARAQSLDARRKLLMGLIRDLPDVTCPMPRGAFYAFPSVKAYLGTRHPMGAVESSSDFARILLDEHMVATVPGEAFGMPGHIRVTYTIADGAIREGLSRIATFLTELERA